MSSGYTSGYMDTSYTSYNDCDNADIISPLHEYTQGTDDSFPTFQPEYSTGYTSIY